MITLTTPLMKRVLSLCTVLLLLGLTLIPLHSALAGKKPTYDLRVLVTLDVSGSTGAAAAPQADDIASTNSSAQQGSTFGEAPAQGAAAPTADRATRRAIRKTQRQLLKSLPNGSYNVVERPKDQAILVLDITEKAQAALEESPLVVDMVPLSFSGGANILVSKNAAGTGTGNNSSGNPRVSGDGSLVVFESTATDLVAGFTDTNGTTDMFLYDVASATIALISKNSAGTGTGNGQSTIPEISDDGSRVVYQSGATNLVAGVTDTNGSDDVFLYDVATGTNTLVTRNSAGTGTGNVGGLFPQVRIAPDGSHLVYQSSATNLVTGFADANGDTDIFLYTVATGTNTLVSRNSAGTGTGNRLSSNARLSADGSLVVYQTFGFNMVTGLIDTNSTFDIFLYTVATGTNTLVSRNSAGTGTANAMSTVPKISADGSRIVYQSNATNLIAGFTDTNGGPDHFLYTVATGTTVPISKNSAGTGTGNNTSLLVRISVDGSHVSFESFATDLVTGFTDTNGGLDVFLYTVATGTNELASKNSAGTGTGSGPSSEPQISADGTRVVYQSTATDLTTDANNNGVDPDVYVYDASTADNTLISTNSSATGTGNAASSFPYVSADGSHVVYQSQATNITTDANNNGASGLDVYLSSETLPPHTINYIQGTNPTSFTCNAANPATDYGCHYGTSVAGLDNGTVYTITQIIVPAVSDGSGGYTATEASILSARQVASTYIGATDATFTFYWVMYSVNDMGIANTLFDLSTPVYVEMVISNNTTGVCVRSYAIYNKTANTVTVANNATEPAFNGENHVGCTAGFAAGDYLLP